MAEQNLKNTFTTRTLNYGNLPDIQQQRQLKKTYDLNKKTPIENGINKIEKYQKIIFFLFATTFISGIFLQTSITDDYNTLIKVKNLFFNKYVSSMTDTVDTFKLPEKFADLTSKIIRQNFTLQNQDLTIYSNVRTTVRTVKFIQDTSPTYLGLDDNWKYSVDSIDSFEEYDPDEETTDDLINRDTGNKFKFNKNDTFLNLGGYCFSFNQTEFLNQDSETIEKKLSILQDDFNFFRALENSVTITIDFLLLNLELNYVYPIVASFKMTATGFSFQVIQMYTIDLDLYKNKISLVKISFEVLTVIFFLIYIILYFYKNKLRTDISICIKQIELEKTQNNSFQHEKDSDYYEKHYFSLFLQEFFFHSNNLSQLLMIIITMICLVKYISHLYLHFKINNDIAELINNNEKVSHSLQNDIILLGMALKSYMGFVTINFLFVFLQLAINIFDTIPEMNVFAKTLSKAANDLISFFLLFLTLFLSATLFTYIFYTKSDNNLESFFFTSMLNLSFILGTVNITVINDFFNISNTVTIFYLLLIIIVYKYIILKLLLSIVLFYYKAAVYEYNSQNNLKIMSSFHDDSINLHWMKRMVNFYRGEVDRLLKCKKKPVNNYAKKVTEIFQQRNLISNNNTALSVNKTSTTSLSKSLTKKIFKLKTDISPDYDISYDDEYSLMKRKVYFESVKDVELLTEYYEKKYRKNFIIFLFYFFFIIIFSSFSLFEMITPWVFNNSQATSKLINDNNEGRKLTFGSIQNLEELRYYVFYGLILDFIKSNNSSMISPERIMFNSILLTVRRAKYNDLYNFTENIRLYDNKDIDSLTLNITSYPVFETNHQITYSIERSYRRLGGYQLKIGLDDTIDPSIAKAMIDEYTTQVDIEFFVDVLEYELPSYVHMSSTIDYTGNINLDFTVRLINLNILMTNYDYPKVVFEIIFLILLIFIFIEAIKDVIHSIKTYNKWVKDTVSKLSEKTRHHREKILPEIFRLILYLISYERIGIFIQIVVSIFFVYFRMLLLDIQIKNMTINGYEYVKKNNMTIYDFRNIIYNTQDYIFYYMCCLVVILFIMSIRFIEILSLGKYFHIMIETIKSSTEFNAYFLGLMILIHPAFISYAYLAFGSNLEKFSTWNKSFFSIINIFFGVFRFNEYSESDPVLGPIFFFIYMFIMQMIMLNFFSSIIDHFYRQVKETFRKVEEKYSLRRVYLFCCFKKKSVLKEFLLPIETEFEYSKKNSMFIINFKSNIDSLNITPAEWADYEFNQIKMYDDALISQLNKNAKIENAYLCKDVGIDRYIFDDCLFKGTEEKHLKISKFLGNLLYVDIIKNLEADILRIEKYQNHLDEFETFQNLHEKLEEIIQINEVNYERVVVLESVFSGLFKELRELEDMNCHLEGDFNDINSYYENLMKEKSEIYQNRPNRSQILRRDISFDINDSGSLNSSMEKSEKLINKNDSIIEIKLK